jgi:hypothetical protein
MPEMPSFNDVIALAFQPVSMRPEQGRRLQDRLLDRVHRSARAHRDLTTVRREDGAWGAAAPGVMRRVLHEGHGMRVQLLQLQAHAPLPRSAGALAEELLVIEGGLVASVAGAEVALPRLHQRVISHHWEHGQPELLRAGDAGASLYVRSRLLALDALPHSEARWWARAQELPLGDAARPRSWCPFGDGAVAIDLHTHEGVASMLLRIAPGARLPDHGHGLNEDCFMLGGDMFLGDILMRAGDYQLALAGGRHVGISSDEGGLFYFHGALPGDASGVAPSA